METKKLQARVFWDYMNPVRKGARMYSWLFGGPIMVKGAKLGYTGLEKAVEGAEWTKNTTIEGVKGLYETTISPFLMLAKSRLVMVKRFLWDVPLATVSAAIRTPIALAKSPLEMARGVRDAIRSVPGNAKEVFNAVRNFRLGDAIGATRKAITDIILPPITKPLAPIVTPSAKVVGEAFDAEWQTVTTLREAIGERIPGGARRIWNAPKESSAMLARAKAERAARRAALLKERDEKDSQIQQAIAKERGAPEDAANDNAKRAFKPAA